MRGTGQGAAPGRRKGLSSAGPSGHHDAMIGFNLLNLRLHASLRYSGMENPPFVGLGRPGDPWFAAVLPEEGKEELFVFEAEDLVLFDPDDGPKVVAPLPAPRFHGTGLKLGEKTGEGETEYSLPRGEYLFMQWRPANEGELLSGMEYFAREAWWEGTKAMGPYLLRRVLEDGKVATQLLRSYTPAQD